MIPQRLSSFEPQGFSRRWLCPLLLFSSLILAALIPDHKVGAVNLPGPPEQQGQQDAQEAVALEPGKLIERELAGGQKHDYRIAQAEGQYSSLSVEQRGVDLVARLTGPDGKEIAVFDSEITLHGRELVELVAETAGSYRVSIEAKQKGAPAGSYVIQFVELRDAAGKDRSLQDARRLYAESIALRRAARYDGALSSGMRVLEIHEELLGLTHPDTATSLNNVAEIYRLKGDPTRAGPLHLRALEIRTKALGPDHPHVAFSLNNLALVLAERGEYIKAGLLYERALEIKEKAQGPDHPDVATSLNNLALIYRVRGDPAKAESLYQRALEIKEKASGPDHPGLASSLNNLALIYRVRGDYYKAEQLHQRALDIRVKALGPDHPDVATSLNNLANIYIHQGDYLKAEPLFRRALDIRMKALGPEHRLVGTVINNLAEIHYWNGDYTKAEQMNRRALDIKLKALGRDHPDVSSTLCNLAHIHYIRGDYAEAERLYKRAVEIRGAALGLEHPNVAASLNDLARFYAAKGSYKQAVTIQWRANAIIERNIALNLLIGSERQKLAYKTTLSEMTDRTLSLHARGAPDDRQAQALGLTTILQRKGRVLDFMSDSITMLRRRLNAQDRALLDRLNDSTAHLARLVLDSPQETTAIEHKERIKAVEKEREELEIEINRRSAGYYARSNPVTVASVQSAIPGNAALIEMAVYRPFNFKAAPNRDAYGEPRYVAYVVRRQGEIRWSDLGEAKAIDGAVAALRRGLSDPTRTDVGQLARSVDKRVMQPLRALLGDATHLLISPDGALNLIPFEALVDEQRRYLIERYSFSYLTSGRDLLRLQIARKSGSRLLVMADPLFGEPERPQIAKASDPRAKPSSLNRKRQGAASAYDQSGVYFAPLSGTEQEARSIKSLFPEASVITGARATESWLKQAAAPRMLHIATHGFFLDDPLNTDADVKIENPLLRSGLALAGANLRKVADDDGMLTALEASGLNLWGTKLVTLSACDTGLGEVKNGEGVYGLRRAFVLAGTETLVMSLWPVSDYATREMMTSYYKGLKQGQGRGSGLRQAQLSMLKRKGLNHPFYWASFIQSGEWANLEGKR